MTSTIALYLDYDVLLFVYPLLSVLISYYNFKFVEKKYLIKLYLQIVIVLVIVVSMVFISLLWYISCSIFDNCCH